MAKNSRLVYADVVALALVIIGALNWGLIGLAHFLTEAANWNLVNQLVGGYPTIEFGIYVLVGLSALWTVYTGTRMISVREAETPTELGQEVDTTH